MRDYSGLFTEKTRNEQKQKMRRTVCDIQALIFLHSINPENLSFQQASNSA